MPLVRAADRFLPALLLVFLLTGCRPSQEALPGGGPSETAADAESGTAPAPPRILLLAVDGLEAEILLPLLHEGRLPELRRLAEEGVLGRIRTLGREIPSPVIWTTVATGKGPEAHGILDFTYHDARDPAHYRLYTSDHRRTKAFWNILSDQGRRVHVIGWFVSYPAEAVNGVLVAQTNTVQGEALTGGNRMRANRKGGLLEDVEGQVHPAEREAEILSLLAEVHEGLPERLREIFGDFPHPLGPVEERFWKASQWSLAADATYVAIADRLVEENPDFDLLALYIGSTDVLAHRFYRYHDPGAFRHPPDLRQQENFGSVLRDYYVEVDRTLGRLLRKLGGPITVVVLSDHGMEAQNREKRFAPGDTWKDLLSGNHQEPLPGVFLAAGPGVRPGEGEVRARHGEELPLLGRMHDVTPTLLALLDLPTGEDMEGRVLTEILDPAFLDAHPVRSVPSHDSAEWLASRKADAASPPDEKARLEQLRQLGYIE